MGVPARRQRKHPAVKVRRDQPYNAEPPLDLLRRSFVTPGNLFYVRSHGSIPKVDPATHRLEISGLVERPLEISLDRLRSDFHRKELTATLYCAGNRREELTEASPMPGKLPWSAGAVANARWTGVSLGEVIRSAGVKEGARHVAFVGLDRDEESGTGTRYGGSVPIEAATGDNALLAYEMNGEPLAPEHGFPLRVVIGGYIGARSVKWISEIVLRQTPSENHYQAREYKLFPPHVTAETAELSEGEMLGELPLNAVICVPSEGEILPPGQVSVRGYAVTGYGRRVERVELSINGGDTWIQADLEGRSQPNAWRFWRAGVELDAGPHQLTVRAVDSSSKTQPRTVEEVWNFQGYANNAWHRVALSCEA